MGDFALRGSTRRSGAFEVPLGDRTGRRPRVPDRHGYQPIGPTPPKGMSRFAEGTYRPWLRPVVTFVVVIGLGLSVLGGLGVLAGAHAVGGAPAGSSKGTTYGPSGALSQGAALFPATAGGSLRPVVPSSGGSGFGLLGAVAVPNPSGAVVSDPATGDVYFSGGSAVTVVHGTAVVGTIPLGNYTELGAYDPQDGFVYFVEPYANGGQVVVLNGTSVVANISTPAPLAHGIVYDPADQEIYVANNTTVTVINGTTVVTSIPVVGVGREAWDLVYDAADGDVYVLVGPGTITILNGTTNLTYFPLVPNQTYPYTLVYDPANALVYVPLSYADAVAVFSGTSYLGAVSVPVAPYSLTVDDANGLVYVVPYAGSTNNTSGLPVLNGTSVLGSVPVDDNPSGAVYDPVNGYVVFAGGNFSVNGSNVADVVNGTDVLFGVPIVAGAVGIGVNPVDGLVYVPCGAGNASVLGPGTFYTLAFHEAGLAVGWTWGLEIAGVSATSNTSDLNLSLPNGTYLYSLERPLVSGSLGANNSTPPNRYNWSETPLPYNGSLVVNGSNVTEPTLNYTITAPDVRVLFTEVGIPSNDSWSVTLNGTVHTSTNGSFVRQLSFTVAPGTYAYSIAEVPGYAQSQLPATGNVTITSAFAVQSSTFYEPTVGYTRVLYEVQIGETGLPAGALFNVSVNGAVRQLVANGSAALLTWGGLPNGTYPYSISDVPGWHESALRYHGSLSVVGGTQRIDGLGVGYATTLPFSEVLYNLTFTELGLPAGTAWNVTVGSTEFSSTSSALVVALPNGSASYTLGAVGGWAEAPLPHSGTVTVAGSSEFFPTFAFSQVTYSLSFVETGLPTGTVWSVVVGSTILYSAGGQLAFSVPNGSFTFSVVAPSGYSSNVSVGTAHVQGANRSVTLSFSSHPAPLLPGWVLPAGGGALIGALVAGLAGLWAVARAKQANRARPLQPAGEERSPSAK